MAESANGTGSSTGELVLLERSGPVAVITLNRPDKLNALSAQMRTELDQRLAAVGGDDDTRVVVLTGRGRAFCAGADLAGGGMSRNVVDSLATFEAASVRQLGLWNLPQPVIAAVNGHCLGRGMELALWCDLVVAASTARFGEPEVRDGSFVSSIVPWLTGPQQAKLIMLTGDTLPAERAAALGLVTEVVEGDDALPAALDLARRLASVPPATARAVKRYVNAAVEHRSLRDGQSYGNAMGSGLRTLSPDELGISELVRVREEQGLKAYLAARDAPFARQA